MSLMRVINFSHVERLFSIDRAPFAERGDKSNAVLTSPINQ